MHTNTYQFSMVDTNEDGDIIRTVSMMFALGEDATHGEVCDHFLEFLKASGYVFSSDAYLEVSQSKDG